MSTEWHSTDLNAQADTVARVVRAPGPVAPASIETPTASQTEDRQQLLPSPRPSSTSSSTLIGGDQLWTRGVKTSPEVRSKPRWMTTAYSGVRVALEVIRESSDVFVPLKSVAGGLSALLKQYDRYIANGDDVRRLILRVRSLANSFTKKPRKNDIKELKRRDDLKKKLMTVLETLDPMLKRLKQFQSFPFHYNADQAAAIVSIVEDTRDAITDYQTSLQQDINDNILMLIESAHVVLFGKLPCAKGAGYKSGDRQKCFRGTRMKILEAIENWVQNNHTHRVYWLNGIAGIGKTTIAQSFAERMFAEGLLGASFFCSRDFPERRNLHFIFPTLAVQLAYRYPNFRTHLVKILTTFPNIGHDSLSNQLNKLLVEPLRSTGLSTIIIIDALDECEDEQPASAILSLLSWEVGRIPSVKFFITGRPESRIREGFRPLGLHPRMEVLLLHEIERRNVDEDIRLFLAHHLRELVKNGRDIDIAAPWPTPADIWNVASEAGGQFIHASTVIKFVESETHNPQERLSLITSIPHNNVNERRSEIDTLYTWVFERSCAHVHSSDVSFFSRMLLVISSIVLLYEQISVADLAKLLGVDSTDIFTPIRSLHSVLLVPDSDSRPICVLHKSFPDYITNHKRCTDSRFYVDSSVHHARLAIRCFELMKTGLKTNICGLPQYAMNDDIKDLSIRRQECIGEALVYACRFWAKHLCSTSQTGEYVTQILESLRKFVQRNLLQWLEVLSIAKDLRSAAHSLIDVEQWLVNVDGPDESLLSWIRECRQFVQYSFDVIEQSTAHIYNSALLWVPASSLIRTLYHGQLTTQASMLNEIGNCWDAHFRPIQLGGAKVMQSAEFSHSGKFIAGWNWSTVKILAAATGVCLATMNGHDRDVNSVTFSPDDMFLKVWDTLNGECLKTFDGHSDAISCVASSPDASKIAYGSQDKTVRVYDIPTSIVQSITTDEVVRSLCFSPNGSQIVFATDASVVVWDLAKEVARFRWRTGSRSVTCSSDGNYIATRSTDGFVWVFQLGSGIEDVGVREQHSRRVTCVSSSVDGRMVASGSEDRTVKVWDAMTGSCVRTFHGHNCHVSSVALSPDSSLVASGFTDGTVRMWSLHDHNLARTIERCHGDVIGVRFSPDGKRLMSVSLPFIRLWDVEKWEELCHQSPLVNMSESRVSFSANGAYVLFESRAEMKRWRIEPYDEDDRMVVLNYVPDDCFHEDVGPYRHRIGSEWIVDQGDRRVCWIPADLRTCNNMHNKMMTFGTTGGRLVTVDLSEVSKEC